MIPVRFARVGESGAMEKTWAPSIRKIPCIVFKTPQFRQHAKFTPSPVPNQGERKVVEGFAKFMNTWNRRKFLSAGIGAGIGSVAATGRYAGSRLGYSRDLGHGRILSETDQVFLAGQAHRILDSARLMPGHANGKWRNLTPYTVHVPGGNMGYPAFWIRDAVMMLESDFIPVAEIEGWIQLMSSVVRDRNWEVRAGVVVPAFAIPDHIDLDGKASFYPGSYETGSKQGGNPWGKYPPFDDQFYYIFAIYYQWKKTRNTKLFRSKIKTAFGEMHLSDLCECVYRAVPSDASTALCVAGDVNTENAKDFGFCDSVFKSGKLLFPSVLKFVAAQQLAELYSAVGLPEKATAFRVDAHKIKTAIPLTFLHASSDGKEAWLYSATGVGHQPDVWGSAYAVYSNAVDPLTAHRVSRALVRAYREKTTVRDGCVKQVTSSKGWQMSISSLGTYQNGGYWGTPVGWYLVAMNEFDEAATAEMALDYIGFLRRYRRPDGISQSWEWFNPDTGETANPLYVATVALPYGCLRVSGLI